MADISPSALYHTANHHFAEGDLSQAEAGFRAALAVDADFAEAHGNLALLLESRGLPAEAEEHYRRALALKPHLAQLHLNFGALLAAQKRFAEAESAYREAIALDPGAPAAWSNLGALLASAKREDEAEACHRQALLLDPAYAKARFNLSYILLRQGRFAEGWQCLEARAHYAELSMHLPCPRWAGEPLAGKSVLLGFEYGHGDMIQFCRYAPLLKGRGAARVGLLCHPALRRLFGSLRGVDEVYAFDQPFPLDTWDYWTPPLSLPGLFGTDLFSIPAHLPYLHADPPALDGAADELRVGLAWRGNPRFENDAERSLPGLATLTPLAGVERVTLFSLQKGVGEDEAATPPAGMKIVDLAGRIGDFADSAAIVAALDLVVCVDTALAHLAGALGKPVWVMLPDYQCDWRWLTERPDSPWYPGVMRLFRQTQRGDWSAVVENVAAELQKLAGCRNSLP